MPVMPVDTTFERLKAALCKRFGLDGSMIDDLYITADDGEDPEAQVTIAYEGTVNMALEEFQALLEEIKK